MIFKLLNYQDHPTVKHYMVFTFKDGRIANRFSELLHEHQIWHERDDSDEEFPDMFAIKHRDKKEAIHLNYLAIGQMRSAFIPNKYFGYLLIAISIIAIVLAIIGFNQI